MRLIWLETSEIGPKKWITTSVKGKFLKYPETLKEIHSALKDGYGVTFIGDNEFRHLIALIKYESGSKIIQTFVIRGTREEINDLQRDDFISSSMLR